MKNITPFSISAPGFFGLNLADSPVDLSTNFALEANNCVIDKFGRVAARKGWTKATTTSADLGSADVECIGELIENDGNSTILFAGNGKLFKLVGTTATLLTYGGGGVAPTISDDNWKFCALNGVAMFWQRGYDPLIYDPAVSTTTFRRLNEKTGTAGTVFQCNEAISAFGRVWAADTSTDKQTVVFSDLLAPHVWTGGTSGSLDIGKIWPTGGDQIVALAAHNNRLIIFGRKQMLIFANATDPANIFLEDSVVGIGCIARDSVQSTGTDILFLSDSGVRSLQRTIQEKSAPLRDISKNVRDELQQYITGEVLPVKSGYSQVNQFYILYFPTSNLAYVFDTRGVLQDGSAKTTLWPSYQASSFYETKGRKFYIGKPGYLGGYSGYLDDTSTYRMTYYTSWIDFGNPIQTSILKRINLTVIGANNQAIIFKWAKDYSHNYSSENKLAGTKITVDEYGVSEYNVAKYTPGVFTGEAGVAGGGAAKVFQFGIETEINNAAISIQKLEVFTKDGKL